MPYGGSTPDGCETYSNNPFLARIILFNYRMYLWVFMCLFAFVCICVGISGFLA